MLVVLYLLCITFLIWLVFNLGHLFASEKGKYFTIINFFIFLNFLSKFVKSLVFVYFLLKNGCRVFSIVLHNIERSVLFEMQKKIIFCFKLFKLINFIFRKQICFWITWIFGFQFLNINCFHYYFIRHSFFSVETLTLFSQNAYNQLGSKLFFIFNLKRK